MELFFLILFQRSLNVLYKFKLLLLGFFLKLEHLKLGTAWLLILIHLVFEIVFIGLLGVLFAELDDIVVADVGDPWLERLALPFPVLSNFHHL